MQHGIMLRRICGEGYWSSIIFMVTPFLFPGFGPDTASWRRDLSASLIVDAGLRAVAASHLFLLIIPPESDLAYGVKQGLTAEV